MWPCVEHVRHVPLLSLEKTLPDNATRAAIAQLGERQTEDLKVPGSIPGLGTIWPLRAGAVIVLLVIMNEAARKGRRAGSESPCLDPCLFRVLPMASQRLRHFAKRAGLVLKVLAPK